MRNVLHPIQRFLRWRTSKGFGVHSPMAYQFITRVIGEKEAHFYAYPEIDALCPRNRRITGESMFGGRDFSIPEARLLLRVLCHFNPPRIIELGNGMEVTNVIIDRALPGVKTELWTPDRHPELKAGEMPFLLINDVPRDAYMVARKYLLDALSGGAITFGRGHMGNPRMMHMWREVSSALPFGMTFTNGDVGIVVARPDLPRQDFMLNF